MFIHIPGPAKAILERLNAAGCQAYVVGGCVRDSLLGKIPHDWDICTNALPDDVIQIFGAENTIPTGLKHGTVSVKSGKEYYEVTTFRIDGEYHDGRRPDSVQFVRSLELDLARRDFTINAMAYNDEIGLIDYFGGQDDLEQQRIRAVGAPEKRFQEDGLRILRAIRFAAQFGFSIEDETSIAMRDNAYMLDKVAAERIGAEIFKIVTAPYGGELLLNDAACAGIICHIIPELAACDGCLQRNRYHYLDVFDHSMAALANAAEEDMDSTSEDTEPQYFPHEWADEYVRMALFLHDIGKPSCKTTDDAGYDHFYGHPKVSAELAENVLRWLRYSKEFVSTVTELVAFHDIEFVPTKPCVRRLLGKVGPLQLKRLLKIRECDNKAHALLARDRFLATTIPFGRVLQEVLEEEAAFKLKDLAVNGYDLMAAGIEPGPEMGSILKVLLEEVVDERLENSKEALVERALRAVKNKEVHHGKT